MENHLKKMYEELLVKYLDEKKEWTSREEDLMIDIEALETQLTKTEEALFDMERDLEEAREELDYSRDTIMELKDELYDIRMRG